MLLCAAKAKMVVVLHGHIARYVAPAFRGPRVTRCPPPRTASHTALLVTWAGFGTIARPFRVSAPAFFATGRITLRIPVIYPFMHIAGHIVGPDRTGAVHRLDIAIGADIDAYFFVAF